MASASWCKETDEKINYTKLCRLLVDGGTQALCSVFDGKYLPSPLKDFLNTRRTLQKLKKLKGKVLNIDQWDKLYPPNGSDPQSKDFDITLLFVLLRNICGLTEPATGWDALPPVADNSLEANLARIKYYRNNTIAHKPSTEINDDDFKQNWQDISSALLSLGLSQDDIDDLKSAPLGEKDYIQLLYDWYISNKDVKTQLEDLKSDTADLRSDTADLKSVTADLKSDTADLKSDTADLKSDTANIKDKVDDVWNVCIEARQINQQIQQLAISDFRPEINTKCKVFHPNTRQWILDQVKSHVDSDQPDSCIMLITAGPGMGKSTLAAKICQTYEDLGCLAACHFFQFSNATRNNPRLMLQSIARQMCDTVPGYRDALVSKLRTDLGKKVSEMNCKELLTILLEEPLCEVEQKDSHLVVVIDALDECSHDPKDELLKALKEKLSCFPSWLRFILTSRPSTNTSALDSTVAVKIRPEDESNIKDLKTFLSFELKALNPQCDNDDNADLVKNLVEMTEGLFLVAFFVIDYMKRENVASLAPEKVLQLFPKGISSVYENYFSRLKEVLLPFISDKEGFYKMLEAVVATRNPLPKNMFYNILCLKSEREVPREEKMKRKDALNSLHWLFPVEGDHVTPFHKSVFDWLILQEDKEHNFSVLVEDGEEVLASQCNDVLSDIRNGKKDLDKRLYLTDSEKYALNFLCHLVDKRSSVIKGDKYGFFSNIYLLTALTTDHKKEKRFVDSISGCDIISSSLLEIIKDLTFGFRMNNITLEDHPNFFRDISYGCNLGFVLQAAHAKEVIVEITPKPLFPYFDEDSLLQTPLLETTGSNALRLDPMTLFYLQYLLRCKDGFIAVLPISCSNSLSTEVYTFQLDGRSITSKSFLGKKLITTSPNINFIVVAQENGNKIEILDATTLEVTSQYESPHDKIQTCYVFGDDQACFVVIKGCCGNKVYVIEGLTGHVHNTITVSEDSTVMDVSCKGHIVVSRTWICNGPRRGNLFTIRDGEVERMNWIDHEGITYTNQELLLYHYARAEGLNSIYPFTLVEKMSEPPFHQSPRESNVEDVIHSEDGHLLAYHHKNSIFIVNTSDGSLLKKWASDVFSLECPNFLFLSRSYLVITDLNFMSVINVQTDRVEHRIYLPYPAFPANSKQYLLLPEEDGKSFNLISNHFHEVSRLVFHNLNLRGLQ
ncbi:uncharacterized protein LOC116290859 isoform X2 [Actinia tenebrosa]|uniref:Uncharacterized protein LOC116290859 isoform X2 n=1 Tax=Actinia tenebrosa TaxID=6105 RepID=A0A6P8HFS7_ACTTE|nr:uncharacterized protein LOC116290859 isoform X2 [Actinia tenebrosa]